MTFQHLKLTLSQSAGVIKHTEVPITFTSNALHNEVIFVLREIPQICCFSSVKQKLQWHYFKHGKCNI